MRRSTVYFTDELQTFQLQAHHGMNDFIVDVAHTERLAAVMKDLGRAAPDFEHFIYSSGGHIFGSLDGSSGRTATFLFHLHTSPTP